MEVNSQEDTSEDVEASSENGKSKFRSTQLRRPFSQEKLTATPERLRDAMITEDRPKQSEET